jgi:hypothetical protein
MSKMSSALSRIVFLLLGITLALGFIVGAEKIGKGLSQVNHRRAEVTVKGVALQKLRADFGELHGELIWRGEKLAEGKVLLNQRREALIALMKESGIDASEVVFNPLDSSRLEPSRAKEGQVDFNRYARGTAPEYLLNLSFVIKTKNVDALAKFSFQEFSVENEVYLNRMRPMFLVSQIDDSKKELLQQAATDALNRAKTLVAGSGSKIGSLLEASQGVFEITPLDREGNDHGEGIDTSSIDKKMRLVVTMRFEIVRE